MNRFANRLRADKEASTQNLKASRAGNRQMPSSWRQTVSTPILTA